MFYTYRSSIATPCFRKSVLNSFSFCFCDMNFRPLVAFGRHDLLPLQHPTRYAGAIPTGAVLQHSGMASILRTGAKLGT
jgi:hypothetical protein